jgi:TrmH family RNA methyltransferase
VIDDTRDLERALARGYRVEYALYCPVLAEGAFVPGLGRDQVYEVSREMMEKVGYRDSPGGFLAVMHTPAERGARDLDDLPETPILGLVEVQKPGNVGALLRTADAAGFRAVLLIDSALDLYNPNIIRSSTGACFRDFVYGLSRAEAQAFFRARDYTTVAAHLDGVVSLYDLAITPRTAVLLGTEDLGLDAGWTAFCDILARIPMAGQITDSLNVSVSGAIFMYEVLRQTTQKMG